MNRNLFFWLFALFIGGAALNLPAQGTAFLYQGRLNDGGNPATGNYDFVFSLYDAPTNGNAVSFLQTNLFVAVTGGLFTTNIDFGPVFTGTNYWLAIATRASGTTNVSTNAFTLLWPRQPLLPAPYAIFANSASNLVGTLPTTQLSGTLTSTQLAGTYSGAIGFTNVGNAFSGTFSGDGTNLVNLNGSQITGGTVADARLSSNVALLNGNQTFGNSNTFTGVNTFTNRQNSFTGSFFGNGLVGWINITGTSVQAISDAGYLLLSPSLTTVTLPPISGSLLTNDIVRISGGGGGGWQVAQNANQSIIGNFSSYGLLSWQLSTVGSAPWVDIASSTDGAHMAAVAKTASTVYLSTDQGQTWSSSSTLNSVWHSIAVSANGSHMIAGQASSGSLFYSTDYGNTWTAGTLSPAGSGNWYAISISANGNNAVAASYPGGIYVSFNGGATWQLSSASSSSSWSSLASSANGSNVVAATTTGSVYTSTNAGLTWNSHTVVLANHVASSADGSKLVASGSSIYTSVNYGNNWQQTSAPNASWTAVASSADGGKLVACITNGIIYASINAGSTWFKQSAPVKGWSAICSSGDGNHLAASISNGGIYYLSAFNQTSTSVGTNGYLAGPQGSAVELQYIGNGQWMPVGGTGTFWAN